jgi:excisionase family DNA binding protein
VSDEFYSFEEALDELRLKEEELKRLVSEGEIRAFRKGETMKLRKSDVESLRAELGGGEVIDLGDVTEELVFEDNPGLDMDAGMATQEIADVDTLMDDSIEDVGEIELEDEIEEPQVVRAAPVRRVGSAVQEEEGFGALQVAVAAITMLLMVIFVPIAMALSNQQGTVSGAAKMFAEMFGTTLPGE